MDATRFDRLTTTLAAHPSRRGLLGAVLAGLLARSDGAIAKKKGKKKDCPKGRKRCGKNCCTAQETCKKGKCVHHCEDGKENEGETDRDCGGSCAPKKKCERTFKCKQDRDCKSGVCFDFSLDLGTRVCGDCRIDSDCASNPSGIRSIANFCNECAADFDCAGKPGRPFCVDAGCPDAQPCICKQCRPGQDGDCPDGQICNQAGSCVPEPEQLGCTPEMNSCAPDASFPCPDGPSNNGLHSCVVLNNGQPFCIGAAICVFCSDDAECPLRDGVPGRCITSCPGGCGGNVLNACVYPFLP